MDGFGLIRHFFLSIFFLNNIFHTIINN